MQIDCQGFLFVVVVFTVNLYFLLVDGTKTDKKCVERKTAITCNKTGML